jgi:lipopolysaccharide transport system ATP-binding protein
MATSWACLGATALEKAPCCVYSLGRCCLIVDRQLLALNPGFVHYLSGRDNAVFGGLLQGLDRRAINARLDAIREFSGLGDFFDRPINTYSSGMLARLGFSLAMQLEPDILLIDETLSVGDSDFREKSSRALNERFQAAGTVVLVSHDESIVTALCDKVLWIEEGRTVMSGPTADVLEAYHRGVFRDGLPQAIDVQ